VQAGIGWCPTWSSAQQPGHVEKVMLVTRRFAENRPAEHTALILALHEAGAWCDEPQNRERLAELLADARYVNLPTAALTPALLGRFDCGNGRTENVPDFHLFHRNDASVPTAEKAARLQRALGAAGLIPTAAASDAQLPRRLFRADLHRQALSQQFHEHTT
jgi:ABC-type nitrate/sulfonate/bicarbonate transport system substrate-binding protein